MWAGVSDDCNDGDDVYTFPFLFFYALCFCCSDTTYSSKQNFLLYNYYLITVHVCFGLLCISKFLSQRDLGFL